MDYGQPKSAEILNAYLQELEAAEKAEQGDWAAKGYIDLSGDFDEPLAESTTLERFLQPTQDPWLLQSTTRFAELEVTTTELERTTTWEPYPEPTQDNELLESSASFDELEVTATDLEPTTTWEPYTEPTGDSELLETTTSSAQLELVTADPGPGKSRVSLQEQFEKESAALAQWVVILAQSGFC